MVSIIASMGVALLAVSAAVRVSTDWVRTTLAIGKGADAAAGEIRSRW